MRHCADGLRVEATLFVAEYTPGTGPMTTWIQIMDLARAMEERRIRSGRLYGPHALRLLRMLHEFHRHAVAEPLSESKGLRYSDSTGD